MEEVIKTSQDHPLSLNMCVSQQVGREHRTEVPALSVIFSLY